MATLLAYVCVGLALTGCLLWRTATRWPTRASFQADQVELARSSLVEATEPNAVLMTTTSVGRPAENINYYSDRYAFYLEELARWGVPAFTGPMMVLRALAKQGFPTYVLFPPAMVEYLHMAPGMKGWLARGQVRLDVVRDIRPAEAARYFVASPHHQGVPLKLVRVSFASP